MLRSGNLGLNWVASRGDNAADNICFCCLSWLCVQRPAAAAAFGKQSCVQASAAAAMAPGKQAATLTAQASADGACAGCMHRAALLWQRLAIRVGAYQPRHVLLVPGALTCCKGELWQPP